MFSRVQREGQFKLKSLYSFLRFRLQLVSVVGAEAICNDIRSRALAIGVAFPFFLFLLQIIRVTGRKTNTFFKVISYVYSNSISPTIFLLVDANKLLRSRFEDDTDENRNNYQDDYSNNKKWFHCYNFMLYWYFQEILFFPRPFFVLLHGLEEEFYRASKFLFSIPVPKHSSKQFLTRY